MFQTYRETGSIRRGTLKVHRTSHKSKAAAVKQACAISRRTPGFVTVQRNGIEVAACRKGMRVG